MQLIIYVLIIKVLWDIFKLFLNQLKKYIKLHNNVGASPCLRKLAPASLGLIERKQFIVI